MSVKGYNRVGPLCIDMNELVILALIGTVGVFSMHFHGPDWNFGFMILFFAGIPLAGAGIIGYIIGVYFIILFVAFTYIVERIITGSWEEPAV